MFYFKLVNIILRHCHSWLARQYFRSNPIFCVSLKAPIMAAADGTFCYMDILHIFQNKMYDSMPYLLYLKKQFNLKLSSAANYRWCFIG